MKRQYATYESPSTLRLLIAHLKQERDELRERIEVLRAEMERRRAMSENEERE